MNVYDTLNDLVYAFYISLSWSCHCNSLRYPGTALTGKSAMR